MRLVLIALGVVCVSVSAAAQSANSPKHPPLSATGWTRVGVKYGHPVMVKYGEAAPGGALIYMRVQGGPEVVETYVQVNCSQRSSRVLTVTRFLNGRRASDQINSEAQAIWVTEEPGTPEYEAVLRACVRSP